MIKYPDGQKDLPDPLELREQREVVPRYTPGPLDHYCPEEQGEETNKKYKVVRSERHRG